MRSLSVVSSAMTSRASMIGMPASTKTLELAREVHDLLALHRLLGDLELKNALVFLDVDRLQPALKEHEVRGARLRRLLGPLDLIAALVECAVAVALQGVMVVSLLSQRVDASDDFGHRRDVLRN